MRFVKCKKEDLNIGYSGFRLGKNQRLIYDFMNGDEKYVEIVDYTHKNIHVCQSSLMGSIKRMKASNVKIVVRGDRIFMIKV